MNNIGTRTSFDSHEKNRKRILFVVESCLRINTSANLCHLAYIQGAIENEFEVDVISVTEQNEAIDLSINLPLGVNWIYYDPPSHSRSFFSTTGEKNKDMLQNNESNIKKYVKKVIKSLIQKTYGIYGRTPTLWVKSASRYRCDTPYDYVISLATPFISHRLGMNLIRSNNIQCKKFIEIWEDPWTLSLFNDQISKDIKKEEERLVSFADQVVYVSPLTLKHQQELFPAYSKNMTWHPLPYYYKQTDETNDIHKCIFGYYGDYYSFSRNLKPFYAAAREMEIQVNIFGNTDEQFASTDRITVKPRVDLKTLKDAEELTTVYVFLCNLKGGQIPGKIYQNSATYKNILFILDGTSEEKEILRKYFERFNRYEFCENNIVSIKKSIMRIKEGKSLAVLKPVEEFSPKKTIKEILQKSLK